MSVYLLIDSHAFEGNGATSDLVLGYYLRLRIGWVSNVTM